MKKYILFCSLFLACYLNSFAQQAFTLQDAITAALNKNTTLIKQQNNLASQSAAIKSAYGNLIPNLNVSGSWNWSRVNDKGGESQLNYFGQETVLPASQIDTRSYSLSAGGNVTLFDGLSNIANINQAKNNYDASVFNLRKLKQDIILQTANLYFAIISDDSLLKYQNENLKYNQELLKKIKEMQQLKMVTLADVYSQEAQTANSEFEYLQTKNNLEKAKISLLNYLSLDINSDFSYSLPRNINENNDLNSEDFYQVYQTALDNRDDYQSQKLVVDNSENQLTIARSDFYPTLTGSYRFSTSATTPDNLFNRKTYSVGLSLNLPIFSNWGTEYSVEAAKVSLENSNEDLKALERQIASDVKNAQLDLQTSKLQLDASNKALVSATESWKIKKESYVLGAATYIDLQQTYNNYLQAQYNNVQAQYNYYTKQYSLLNAIGKLGTE